MRKITAKICRAVPVSEVVEKIAFNIFESFNRSEMFSGAETAFTLVCRFDLRSSGSLFSKD